MESIDAEGSGNPYRATSSESPPAAQPGLGSAIRWLLLAFACPLVSFAGSYGLATGYHLQWWNQSCSNVAALVRVGADVFAAYVFVRLVLSKRWWAILFSLIPLRYSFMWLYGDIVSITRDLLNKIYPL